MRVALALGRTLGELRQTLTSAELVLWLAYDITHGLPDRRTEAGVALSGAAVCQSLGVKVQPGDLMPVFTQPDQGEREQVGLDQWKAWVSQQQKRKKTRKVKV